jgi:hypothetical protein
MRRRAMRRRAGPTSRFRRGRPFDADEELDIDLTVEAIMAGGGKGSVS